MVLSVGGMLSKLPRLMVKCRRSPTAKAAKSGVEMMVLAVETSRQYFRVSSIQNEFELHNKGSGLTSQVNINQSGDSAQLRQSQDCDIHLRRIRHEDRNTLPFLHPFRFQESSKSIDI